MYYQEFRNNSWDLQLISLNRSLLGDSYCNPSYFFLSQISSSSSYSTVVFPLLKRLCLMAEVCPLCSVFCPLPLCYSCINFYLLTDTCTNFLKCSLWFFFDLSGFVGLMMKAYFKCKKISSLFLNSTITDCVMPVPWKRTGTDF